jgi:hypothetical protein
MEIVDFLLNVPISFHAPNWPRGREAGSNCRDEISRGRNVAVFSLY